VSRRPLPATDLVTLMNEDIDSVGGKNITAMTLWSWQRVFDANMDKVVDPRAIPAIDQLARNASRDRSTSGPASAPSSRWNSIS
jgi:hypothetical protein